MKKEDEPAYCLVLTERQLAMLYVRTYDGGGKGPRDPEQQEIDALHTHMAGLLCPKSSEIHGQLRLEAGNLVSTKYGWHWGKAYGH